MYKATGIRQTVYGLRFIVFNYKPETKIACLRILPGVTDFCEKGMVGHGDFIKIIILETGI